MNPLRTAGVIRWHVWSVALGVTCLLGLAAGAQSAPPAGTPIGNQASATYLDASNTPRTATSNLVTTIVQQVASFTLNANGARTEAPGGQAVFPHTLTNTGNGTDNFSLALVNQVGDDFDLTGLAIYADANGDGVPDNFTALASTGPVAAGGVFQFVVVGSVPGTQIGGQVSQARITGTSTFDGSQTAFNTDVVTVTGNAVVTYTKSINQASGASPSGPYTYTLSYSNTGNSTATNIQLLDLIPAGMTYVLGSARWSVTGAVPLTDLNALDAQGVPPNTIAWDFGITNPNTVTAVLARIVPGATGTLTFNVNVNGGLPPSTINNSADYTYNDGASNVGPFTTNNAPFTINQASAVVFNGQTVASAFQGATVTFSNTLTNNGNGADVFNITIGVPSFPVGTTFALFQSDGVTPLTDTNGDALPDPGPLAAGASTVVVLKATRPPGAGAGGPYTVGKTATSVANPAVSALATDQLTAIVGSSVDLTNDAAGGGAPGAGPGPEPSAVKTNTVSPGATTTFTLYANNNVGPADNYDLVASTDPTFTTLSLPAGWSVTFRDAGSSVISNTGNVPAGGNVLVYADVSVPAGYAAGAVQVYFRARSPVTGAQDRKHDAVSVSVIRSLNVIPNNSAQVAPGGAVVYTHLVSNNGNVVEGDGAGSTVTFALTNNQVGWSAALYHDTNNNGVLDGGDLAIADLGALGGVAPGSTVRVFVNVFSPAGAALGSVNVTTLSATTTNVGYASPAPPVANASDNTTVINGQLQLVKQQVLDVTCDGLADGAYTLANLTVGAVPGACLRYQITVTNVGTATVNNVVVSDATPPNTTYSGTVAGSTTVGGIATPANGAAGTITATIGTLGPGQSAVVEFGIRINP